MTSKQACRPQRFMFMTTTRPIKASERAAAAGAVVRNERHQGKGHVVRRMFADIDADLYIMVDGDATYDPTAAPDAVAEMVRHRLDFINIARRTAGPQAYRSGHQIGNALLTALVALLFGREFTDMLSGYKLFSRRFVKSFPALSKGFEIETELTIHALELTMPVAERIANLQPTPDRVHQQVEHGTGRPSHSADNRAADKERAAIGVLWSDRRYAHLHCHRFWVFRSCRHTSRRAWSRAFRPLCWPPHWLLWACRALPPESFLTTSPIVAAKRSG